ncbi:hypothetical protein J6590_043198 [Homalodisca vitripennis]|nr:hypothetical protein J6590_043198 [Homalodisca vitripennis]
MKGWCLTTTRDTHPITATLLSNRIVHTFYSDVDIIAALSPTTTADTHPVTATFLSNRIVHTFYSDVDIIAALSPTTTRYTSNYRYIVDPVPPHTTTHPTTTPQQQQNTNPQTPTKHTPTTPTHQTTHHPTTTPQQQQTHQTPHHKQPTPNPTGFSLSPIGHYQHFPTTTAITSNYRYIVECTDTLVKQDCSHFSPMWTLSALSNNTADTHPITATLIVHTFYSDVDIITALSQQQLQIHIQLPLHCRVHRYRCITSYSPAPCTSLLAHFSLSNRIVHTFYSDVDIIAALVHRYRCITSYSPAPCTSLLAHFSLSNRIVHTFYSDVDIIAALSQQQLQIHIQLPLHCRVHRYRCITSYSPAPCTSLLAHFSLSNRIVHTFYSDVDIIAALAPIPLYNIVVLHRVRPCWHISACRIVHTFYSDVDIIAALVHRYRCITSYSPAPCTSLLAHFSLSNRIVHTFYSDVDIIAALVHRYRCITSYSPAPCTSLLAHFSLSNRIVHTFYSDVDIITALVHRYRCITSYSPAPCTSLLEHFSLSNRIVHTFYSDVDIIAALSPTTRDTHPITATFLSNRIVHTFYSDVDIIAALSPTTTADTHPITATFLSDRIFHTFYSDVNIITALSQQQLQIHIQLPLHCRVHRYRCITSYSPAPCTSLLAHFSLSNRIVHTFYSDVDIITALVHRYRCITSYSPAPCTSLLAHFSLSNRIVHTFYSDVDIIAALSPTTTADTHPITATFLSDRIVHTFYSDVDIITALSQQQLQIHIQLPLHCRVHRYRCITSYSPAPCTSLLEHFSLSNRIVHTFYSDVDIIAALSPTTTADTHPITATL